MKKGIEWIEIKDRLPNNKDRVLVFSPVFEWGHPNRYRVMEGQFVRICTEATKWISLKCLGAE